MSKEGKYGVSTPYNVEGSVWKETFNSPFVISSNGGTATDISCFNGVGTFNGTSSCITYTHIRNGVYSIRIKLRSLADYDGDFYLLDYSGEGGLTGFVRASAGSVISSSGTVYVDGVLTATLTSTSKEIVVSGITLLSIYLYVGSDNEGANFFSGSIDSVEEFDYNLDATDVEELFINYYYTSYSWSQQYFKDSETFNNGKVLLAFDDGYLDIYTAGFPLFTEKGIPVTIWADADFIGYEGGDIDHPAAMQWSQLVEMHEAGHDIQGHAMAGITGDDASIRADLEAANALFVANGLPSPNHFAYPGDQFNDRIIDVVDDYYKTARTVSQGFMTRKSSFYKLSAYGVGVAFETLTAAMDKAKTDKTAIAIFGHKVGGDPPNNCPVETIEAIIDYGQLIGLDFITRTELYELLFYIDLRLSRPSAIDDQIDIRCKNRLNSTDSISIERSDNDGIDYSEISVLAPGETDYSDTGLTLGKNYYYRARGFKGMHYLPYSRVEFTSTQLTLTVATTGNGTGVATFKFRSREDLQFTLDGNAYFYTDAAGTLGETQTLNVWPEVVTTIYIKCTSGTSNLTINKNILRYIELWTSGTDAPSLGGNITQLSKIEIINVQGNNTLSGDISKFYELTSLFLLGSNTITGDITLLTKLNYIQCHRPFSGSITNLILLTYLYCDNATNTLSGDISGHILLTVLRVLGNNTLTGSVSGLTLLEQLYVTGTSTLSGDIGLITTNLLSFRLTTFRATNYTSGGNFANLVDASYISLNTPIGYSLATAMVDTLLNDINNTRTAGRRIYVNVAGYNEIRSHLSDTAVKAIIADLGTVTNNQANGNTIDDGNVVSFYDSTDEASITKDENNHVTRWNTKYGYVDSDLTGYGGTPHWSSNGVLFDGVGDYLQRGFALLRPYTMYIVLRQPTWTLHKYILDGYSTYCSLRQETPGTPNILWNVIAGTQLSLAINTWGIIRVKNNSNAATSTIQLNNIGEITFNSTTAQPNGLTLGCRYQLTTYFGNIEYREIIIRKVSDNLAEEVFIYNYLANKYGLPTI